MSRPLALSAVAAAAGVLALLLALRPPDLAPVMPEVDGVHPVRALQALRDTFRPGAGFLDKYPPLGSFLLGLAVAAGPHAGLAAQADAITQAPEPQRRVLLWSLRDELRAALARERAVSGLALALCAALVVLLAARLARAQVAAQPLALAGPLLAGVAFAAGDVPRVYAGTTNVDALALAPALAAVLLALHRRWAATGAALALAVALKDPHVALVPVLLAAAAWLGGRAALLRAGLAAALVYALASGAASAPATWWRHVTYLVEGGVEGVDRIDRADPAGWWQLLRHAAWLLFAGAGGVVALVVVRPAGVEPGARRERALVLAAALAPLAFFVLPIGFAYARFLLPTLALLLAWVGAGVARAAGLRLGASRAAAGLVAALALAGCGLLVLRARTVGGGPDARELVVARLDALAPQGGRVLLFADEREHGPPLDPSRWAVEVAGLNEVAPRLAALRERAPGGQPDFLLVLGFPTVPPSGAPRPAEPEPRPGERVAGLYEVAEVLRAPRGRLERAVAWRPDITLLRRVE